MTRCRGMHGMSYIIRLAVNQQQRDSGEVPSGLTSRHCPSRLGEMKDATKVASFLM